MKAKTDIEIIDRLLSSDLFQPKITVTYLEIMASPFGPISRELIDFMMDLTDKYYYFTQSNEVLVLPRISPIE
jgi:hypothetical protein